jgi:hypothetical protein
MCLHAPRHEAFTTRDQLPDYVDETLLGSEESVRTAVPLRFSAAREAAPKTTSNCSYVKYFSFCDISYAL